MNTTPNDIFNQMAQKWPSTLVSATEVKQFSGGILSGKTLQNRSSLGQSVPESLKVGNKRAYVAESLADWLRQRSEGGAA